MGRNYFYGEPPVALAPLGTLSQSKKHEDKDPAPAASYILPFLTSDRLSGAQLGWAGVRTKTA